MSRNFGKSGSRATAAQHAFDKSFSSNVDNSNADMPERNLAPGRPDPLPADESMHQFANTIEGSPGSRATAAQINSQYEQGGSHNMYARPCLQVYKSIAKDLQKKKEYRQLYFLEAIVQGAMDVHTEVHLAFDPATHSVTCSQCGEAVAGESAWAHFAFDCPFTCTNPKLKESAGV